MKRYSFIASLFTIMLILTSCSSNFWEGMAAGMGGFGGGMYGGGMYGGGMYGGGASMYSGVPYGLQPNVAADAAASSVMNNVTSNVWNNANEGQKIIDNMAKDVWKNGVPATPVQTGGGSSTSSSSSSRSTSSSSGHRCNLCKGTGRKVRESWSGDKTSTKWCNECNKSVGMGHSHTNCDLCGGDGWCD